MNRILKAFFPVLLLSVIAAVTAVWPTSRGWAQSAPQIAADPAVAQVQRFYDDLIKAMKSGGTTKSRYDKLRPAVEETFDLPTMTATAVGPSWPSISDSDKEALIDAFTRMTIANYAKNFSSYNGETFSVDPHSIARGSDKFVKSSLKTSDGSTVVFNYRMHEVGSVWKITDVYLEGNISQMAQKRADFASTLASGGPQGLAQRINSLTQQILS